ncbi:uncharacterized protein TRIVIDRAFT_215729 [Trichoderma virens Gv29-8]|uniref:Uncharacterized protein n=1 Tax=Hypocrea virens (strain Gv29-8 / FGSC 10586) TaxID=413071 RepID=G9MLA6_HYPVG|nr:uncharacterized protein TRIVIDRAFT_215729 [Trichoderma virens Gv29-8]EHK24997.1 hypothetical protein TRIVIDRAFT_215729 [Trichoderma virens Gv29-8]
MVETSKRLPLPQFVLVSIRLVSIACAVMTSLFFSPHPSTYSSRYTHCGSLRCPNLIIGSIGNELDANQKSRPRRWLGILALFFSWRRSTPLGGACMTWGKGKMKPLEHASERPGQKKKGKHLEAN